MTSTSITLTTEPRGRTYHWIQLLSFVGALAAGALVYGMVRNQIVATRRVDEVARLYQLQCALANYAVTHKQLPPVRTTPADGGEGLSWRVLVLPFLGQHDLYQQFDLTASWNSPKNLSLIEGTAEPLFGSPCCQGYSGLTGMLAVTKNGNWLYALGASGAPPPESATVVSLVATDARVPWSRPVDLELEQPSDDRSSSVRGPCDAGLNAACADLKIVRLPTAITADNLPATVDSERHRR